MQAHSPEIDRLVEVLHSFPEERQEALAAYYRREVEDLRDVEARLDKLTPNQTARLKSLIQEGIDSGPAVPFDAEEIKREGRRRRAAERRQ
ncbi:MAG: hypothetical protein AAF791_00750 [Bacteroidota bacterium]